MPIDALKISPKYDSRAWTALDIAKPAHWPRAEAILRDRLDGRFLRFANDWISDPFSGFVVLAIDSLLAETIQQFRNGATSGKGKSEQYLKAFLSGARFQPDFDSQARDGFYHDIRCGLLHQAEAKEMWRVKRGRSRLLEPAPAGHGYIIDVQRFHSAIQGTLEDYCADLLEPQNDRLRLALWTKMDHIFRIREARGLVYESVTETGEDE